jgi:hypothetical protein
MHRGDTQGNLDMDLLDTILSARNGGVVSEIAHRLGLSDGDARKLITTIAPTLGQGIAQNSADSANPNNLIKALKSGNHAIASTRRSASSRTSNSRMWPEN